MYVWMDVLLGALVMSALFGEICNFLRGRGCFLVNCARQDVSKMWGYETKMLFVTSENAMLNKWGINGPTERAIYSAIKEWEQKTCVRFVPRTDQKDYIEFFDGSG